jgi:hypothetical protein
VNRRCGRCLSCEQYIGESIHVYDWPFWSSTSLLSAMRRLASFPRGYRLRLSLGFACRQSACERIVWCTFSSSRSFRQHPSRAWAVSDTQVCLFWTLVFCAGVTSICETNVVSLRLRRIRASTGGVL